jgi:hypothetical protein
MRLLLRVPIEISCALVDINDETIKYLLARRAVFTTAKALLADLADMRFWWPFATFHTSLLDLISELDEDEEHLFVEQGYWEVSDDFCKDADVSNVEYDQIVIDKDGFYLSAHKKHGLGIITRNVPFSVLGVLFK